MTVGDLIQPYMDSLGFEDKLFQGRLIAYDGKDGKIVFDTNNNKIGFYKKFMLCEVSKIWADVKEIKGYGYSNYFAPVLCVYLYHAEVEKIRSDYSVRTGKEGRY